MGKRLFGTLLVLSVAGLLSLYALGIFDRPSATSANVPHEHATYQCAMHPEIVSNEPGFCPICQMQLQRVENEVPSELPAAPNQARAAIAFYRHPMRPEVVSPVPAKDEMGMDYIAVYEEAPGESASASAVPGHAAFSLSAERQQLIGVTRTRVEFRPLEVEIRAFGRVAYDPMLYQAVVEYREAWRSRAEIGRSSLKDAPRGADAILRGAWLKLRQQGLSEAQISEFATRSADPVELLLPGQAVWIYAQVYEYEIGLVKPGQIMTISSPAAPGHTFTAQVTAIDPILDPMTRTVRVRALVETPEADLRPESFVDVRIKVPLGQTLALPEEAVLDTGEHQIVFVVTGEGRFEPRSVTLGRQAEAYYEVLSGLEAGDDVVTSANFLIDSESRFRAAAAG